MKVLQRIKANVDRNKRRDQPRAILTMKCSIPIHSLTNHSNRVYVLLFSSQRMEAATRWRMMW